MALATSQVISPYTWTGLPRCAAAAHILSQDLFEFLSLFVLLLPRAVSLKN
jgi:hypothetical protein